jgi:putative peptidoglycan lipid II flippase
VRGAFDAEDAHYTALVLQGYSIGLPAYIAVKVFSTAFFSRQDTKTPVKISIIVALMNIALALSLIYIAKLGVAGIAMSTGIVGWLQIALLARALKNSETSRFDERFKRVLPRIILSSVAMSAIVYAVMHSWAGSGYDAASLTALGALGIASYTAAVFATGAITLSEIKSYFKRTA